MMSGRIVPLALPTEFFTSWAACFTSAPESASSKAEMWKRPNSLPFAFLAVSSACNSHHTISMLPLRVSPQSPYLHIDRIAQTHNTCFLPARWYKMCTYLLYLCTGQGMMQMCPSWDGQVCEPCAKNGQSTLFFRSPTSPPGADWPALPPTVPARPAAMHQPVSPDT